ncbi:MAG: hypothetical protein AABY55_01815 [Candidatus Omnitrophota bacterium]
MKNKEPNLNREREFTVVLEALHSDFRVFGEGLSALREKVGGLSEKVDVLTLMVGILTKRVDRLSDKVDGIFEMTGRNTEDIHSIKTDLKKFYKRMTLLEQNFSNN